MQKTIFTLLITVFGLVGCVPSSGLRYSLNTPPITLVPVAFAGVSDERGDFRRTFCAVMLHHGSSLEHARPCNRALHRLRGEKISNVPDIALRGLTSFADVRLVIVPGVFGECVARYALPFSDSAKHIQETHGLSPIEWIPVSGRSSSKDNARKIAEWFAANPTEPSKRLIVLGYSKGISDILEAVHLYPGLFSEDTAIVSIAGSVSGTPIADRAVGFYSNLAKLPLPDCKPGDGGEVRSLTREHRLSWLAQVAPPSQFRFYSLAAFAPKSNISRALRGSYTSLSSLDERNDGQVIFQDAVIPGSVLLGYANADHWAITLPLRENLPMLAPFLNRNGYPRTVLLESILSTVIRNDRQDLQ